VEPVTKLGWTGRTLGIYTVHNWTLGKSNNQTYVYVEESMVGIMASMVSISLNKSLDRNMQNCLERLKNECGKQN
jgi:uncharacterized membrane protein